MFPSIHAPLPKREVLSKLLLSSQANEILSSFDDRLRQYATKQLTKVRVYRLIMIICLPVSKHIFMEYALNILKLKIPFSKKRLKLRVLI